MDEATQGIRVVRREEVSAITGLARATIYKKVAEGTFPAPLRLGSRAVGWRLADIKAWLDAPERRWNPTEAK